MGSSSENILKQSFGGVYSNELFAEGGRLYSERPEPFSYISVEVRFKKKTKKLVMPLGLLKRQKNVERIYCCCYCCCC